MFFFIEEKDPVWRQYADELGVTAAMQRLEKAGYKSEWVAKAYGPDAGASFHLKGGKFNKSSCPYFDGWWQAGGFGAVQCSTAEDLFPGFIYYGMCRANHEGCPFYQNEQEKTNEQMLELYT